MREYLLADSRRFALGTLRTNTRTNDLISAFAPYARPEVVHALEERVCNWVYYVDTPDPEARSGFSG